MRHDKGECVDAELHGLLLRRGQLAITVIEFEQDVFPHHTGGWTGMAASRIRHEAKRLLH